MGSRIRFYFDPQTGEPHTLEHDVSEDEVEEVLSQPLEDRSGSQSQARAAPEGKEKTVSTTRFPPGWDEDRVRRVLEHYETQSDEEAVAEDEAAYESPTHTMIGVPVELVPAVRDLIAKRQAR